MFQEYLSLIYSDLSSKLKSVADKILEEVQSSDKELIIITTELKNIREEIERLKERESEIKDIINKKKISRDDFPFWYSNDPVFWLSSYDWTNHHLTAYNKVLETKEYINLENFKALRKDMTYTMDLAMGKEQRNLFLSFVNQDWKSLGVDIPPFNIVGFNAKLVEDGMIINKDKLIAAPVINPGI